MAGERLGPGLEPLAIRMAVRAGGRDVGLTAGEVAAAFPRATPKLAVFVHGLAETDDSWRRRAGDSAPYGDRLHAEFGYTPVYVRYNTGRHVSDSGHDLADLLGALEAAWPEPVQEILLAGHSMGGLVIRSACHYGREASAGWVERVRHVFYLGSPHMGAPLARAAGVAGWVLSKVPETRPFADLAAGPSRSGTCATATCSMTTGPAAAPAAACAITGSEVLLLACVSHYAISATVTADPASPLGAVVGDLLVQPTGHRPCPQRVHRSVTVKDCWQISHQPSSLGT